MGRFVIFVQILLCRKGQSEKSTKKNKINSLKVYYIERTYIVMENFDLFQTFLRNPEGKDFQKLSLMPKMLLQ